MPVVNFVTLLLVIVGVGDLKPTPIPKTDPMGRPLGFWHADEVLQVDPRSQGRGASIGAEKMSEEGSDPAAVGLGATPGSEHLSALRETYLKLLASEQGFGYHRLRDAEAFSRAWRDKSLARPVTVRGDARLLLAGLAFALLLVPSAMALWRSRPRAWVRSGLRSH